MRTSSQFRSALMALFVAAAAVLPLEAQAHSNQPTLLGGKTNRDGGAGCAGAGCHSTGAISQIVLGQDLNPGETGLFRVMVSKLGDTTSRMGLAVTASDSGSPLSVVSGQKMQLVTTASGSDALVHNADLGTLPTGTGASYDFNYTMPASAAVGSTHTLYVTVAFGVGNWTHASNFTVTASPPNPTSLTPTNITQTAVDFSWTGGGPNYRLVYKTGNTPPIHPADGTAIDLGAVTSTSVTGLTQGTQYAFKLFSRIGTTYSHGGPGTGLTTLGSGPALRFVNAATGVNSGVCSSFFAPCKTITYAMSQAVTGTPGDEIFVFAGTYNTGLGEVFPIAIKSGVQLEGLGAAANVIVDASGSNQRVFDSDGNNASTVLKGFTITGGSHRAALLANAQGGGVFIHNGSSITVQGNIFIDNEARAYDGVDAASPSGGEAYGGAIVSSFSSPTITNNVFVSNVAQGGNGVSRFDGAAGGSAGNAHGGAVFIGGGSAIVVNNTFHANEARGGQGGSSNALGGGSGGSAFNGALEANNAIIRNNIFTSNIAVGGAGGSGTPSGAQGNSFNGALNDNGGPATTNNLFFGNTSATPGDTIGSSALSVDPLYVLPPGNLRIPLSSPARGAGTPTNAPSLDLDLRTRPNPPSIGAFDPTPLITYNLVLEGAQQVPPAATAAVGNGTATYNQDTRQLTLNLPYSGLSSPENMAHIHGPAARGANASVIINLAAGSPKTDSVVLTPGQASDLLAGNLYVNVHTDNFPNGEIRAQIDNLGAAAKPMLAVTKDGSGSGTVTSAPAGINCGVDCSEAYSLGTPVALTATAGGTSVFLGWSGACSGTGACNVTMDAAKSVTATFVVASESPRLGNISTRGQVLTGNDVMIGGFVIGGSVNKTVVVRARGPSLIPFGITNAITDPMLQLVRSSDQATIATNDNWGSAANAADVTASGFAPSNPLEAAILVNLPPGAYTAIVSGAGGGTGVGIVEVFEVDHPEAPLSNISTRGQVLTGNDVMIGGFVIQGNTPRTVVVRARGPSLVPFGITNAIVNPTLQLVRSSDQTTVATNDDWGSAANAAAVTASGFAPSDAQECAILVTLDPGAYTAIVSGVGGGVGVGIVEVFAVP